MNILKRLINAVTVYVGKVRVKDIASFSISFDIQSIYKFVGVNQLHQTDNF